LLLGLLLPVAGMLYFAVAETFESRRTETRMIDVQRGVTLGLTLRSVIHELQKERGASAVFLGSEGKSFGPELAR
jgi:hypothetical protein